MNEQDIINRLVKKCTEFQQDDYDEWAIEAIPIYQEILDDLGLTAFSVVGGHPNDGNVDCIVLRMPWSEEDTFPDPEWIEDCGKTTYDPKYIVEDDEGEPYCYIRELVLFFVKLGEKVKTFDRVKNMREAINYLEAAIYTEPGEGSAPPNPEERNRLLQEAMLHVSIAMRPEPEPAA